MSFNEFRYTFSELHFFLLYAKVEETSKKVKERSLTKTGKIKRDSTHPFPTSSVNGG